MKFNWKTTFFLIKVDHVIDWDQAKVIDRESNRVDRWIKEAIHIRIQEGTRQVDEVSSTLPHLRQPVRPESERRTAIRQTVPKKTSVEVETSTLILKMLFLYEFHHLLYRGFRFSFLCFFVSSFFSFLRTDRLVQWSSARHYPSVRTIRFRGLRSDSLRFLRTKRLSFASNILATRCVSVGSGRRTNEATAL